MPGRVSENAFAAEFGRAQAQDLGRRSDHILDHDVEMNLLWDDGAWPGRLVVVGGELEREPRARLIVRDDYEIVSCVRDGLAQEGGVEIC